MTAESHVLPCGCMMSFGTITDDDGTEHKDAAVFKSCGHGCPNAAEIMAMIQEKRTIDPEFIFETKVVATVVSCPACGVRMDAFKPLGESAMPDPGSIAICATCAAVAVYDHRPDGSWMLRMPTGPEQDDMKNADEIWQARDAVKRMIEARR